MSETRARLLSADDGWVPTACTLPTVEQPVRRREFDDLFAADVVAVARETPTRTRLELRPEPAAASRAAALAVAETGCCSFFSFDLAIREGAVSLSVATTPAQQEVLAALTVRAEARVGARSGRDR